jgi:hypothetical protein
LVLRRTYATEAVEQAVVEGITRHGDDFVLVVEAAGDSDGNGTDGTPPVRAVQKSAGGSSLPFAPDAASRVRSRE